MANVFSESRPVIFWFTDGLAASGISLVYRRAGVDVVNGTVAVKRLWADVSFGTRFLARQRCGHAIQQRRRSGIRHLRQRAVQQALCAQLRQPAVEVFAGLAEEFRGGYRQRAKDGKRRAIPSAPFREQELMQRHRFFCGFTFTCVEATTTSSFSDAICLNL